MPVNLLYLHPIVLPLLYYTASVGWNPRARTAIEHKDHLSFKDGTLEFHARLESSEFF